MTLAAFISILGAVNMLLSVLKEVPGVLDEAKSLLDKVAPFIATANAEVQAQFAVLKAKLDQA